MPAGFLQRLHRAGILSSADTLWFIQWFMLGSRKRGRTSQVLDLPFGKQEPYINNRYNSSLRTLLWKRSCVIHSTRMRASDSFSEFVSGLRFALQFSLKSFATGNRRIKPAGSVARTNEPRAR